MFNVYYRNQHACRVQPLSAELWITGHELQHGSKKRGHIWSAPISGKIFEGLAHHHLGGNNG